MGGWVLKPEWLFLVKPRRSDSWRFDAFAMKVERR